MKNVSYRWTVINVFPVNYNRVIEWRNVSYISVINRENVSYRCSVINVVPVNYNCVINKKNVNYIPVYRAKWSERRRYDGNCKTFYTQRAKRALLCQITANTRAMSWMRGSNRLIPSCGERLRTWAYTPELDYHHGCPPMTRNTFSLPLCMACGGKGGTLIHFNGSCPLHVLHKWNAH